ncbi:MAG: glycosyltransferase family 2 protein [Oscillospiraceae bacterium]|nr:glycosyltransferase family 2 protein [Oscillospiraceae bacterium]
MTAILIPAYEPDMILAGYVRELTASGYPVVVADDGSGPDYAPVFAAAAEAGAKVLTFSRNRGKGAVLKDLYRHVLAEMPDCSAVITADSDGQHAAEDVRRADELLRRGESFVLGVREFRRMPFRSKMGNGLSRFVFALSASYWLSDNQTGLRGFAREQLPAMLRVPGERYDYELSVLWYAALGGVPIRQLTIQTIYHDNNAKTHFRTVQDTLLLYRNLARCNRFGVICRGAALIALVVLDAAGLAAGLPWAAVLTAVWAAEKLAGLALKKTVTFRGLPLKGALREILYSALGLAVTLGLAAGMRALGAELPLSLHWLIGRAVALPVRYFACEAFSKMAVSRAMSSEISVPK